MSELSEDKKENFESKYRTGERVTAKVLKVLILSVTYCCIIFLFSFLIFHKHFEINY